MPLSTFTGIVLIGERSEATPGLWNTIFSTISANLDTLNSDKSQVATLGSTGTTQSVVGFSTNTLRPEASFNTVTLTAAPGQAASAVAFVAPISTNTIRPDSGNTILETASVSSLLGTLSVATIQSSGNTVTISSALSLGNSLVVPGAISIYTTGRSLMSLTQGTFSQAALDPAVYIAPQPRSGWTISSEGLYVQHRLSGAPGASGAFTHDGIAAEINVTGSQVTNGFVNGLEASVIVSGGNSQYSDLRAVTANTGFNSGTTGNVTVVSVIRAQAAVDNSGGGVSTGTLVGIWAEQQAFGATANYNIYAPGGTSRFGIAQIDTSLGGFAVGGGPASDAQILTSSIFGVNSGLRLLQASAGNSWYLHNVATSGDFRLGKGATTNTFYITSNGSVGINMNNAKTIFAVNGASSVTSGSAIAPAMTFLSDNSMGWYSSASSVMALSYGGLGIKAGTNASFGTATLGSNGSVNVATTYVAAGDVIFLTDQTAGGTLGDIELGGIRAGSGFTILSTSVTDTSVVGWMIVRPT